MSKKISQMDAKTSVEAGDLFVIVDVDDGGNKKVDEANVKTSLLGDITFADSDISSDDDITITRDGEIKLSLLDNTASFPNLVQLFVPKGLNSANPGVVPEDYKDDLVGLDWFGAAGVSSKLRIAGRIEMAFADAHVMPSSDDTVALGSMANKFKAVYATDIASPKFILKAADEVVNNSDTLQDDNHFTTSLESGGKYKFRFHLIIEEDDDFIGLKVALSGDAVVANLAATIEVADTGAGTVSTNDLMNLFGDGGVKAWSNTGAGINWVNIEGTIEVTTAGVFKLRWAQGSAAAQNTTIKRGSSLTIVRTN